MDKQSESEGLQCGLTLEDEFTLTRIRSNAHEFTGAERDAYLWSVVFKMICRERAYKTVLAEIGVSMDTNMDIFDKEQGD